MYIFHARNLVGFQLVDDAIPVFRVQPITGTVTQTASDGQTNAAICLHLRTYEHAAHLVHHRMSLMLRPCPCLNATLAFPGGMLEEVGYVVSMQSRARRWDRVPERHVRQQRPRGIGDPASQEYDLVRAVLVDMGHRGL